MSEQVRRSDARDNQLRILTAAASRRFAALMVESFRAREVLEPLPPAVRLPLSR